MPERGLCAVSDIPSADVCGAGCVFVLSAADFSIPSLFQYNVYAMELFSDFSAYGKAVNSLWLAMPLMLLILLVVWLTQSRLKQILLPVSYRKTVPLYLSRTTVSLMRAAVFLSVLQILIPPLQIPILRDLIPIHLIN